ncbi:hypothetical protein ACNVED_08865 [Legionella sp. D16C41]|uniref:hypothetical protein n=1 Tax=Legionella sp. D16C41 TaxID=3402688 RepID=UPI003AF6D026
MKVWTLGQYLRLLREGQLNPSKPFAKQEDELIEIGRLAKKVAIPPLEINFPIHAEPVEKIYQLLKPVLTELVNNEEFSWSYHYGFFSAKEVAMGYLSEAVNTAIFKASPTTCQEIELQKLLFYICETLSSGVEVNKAVHIINDAHLRNQFKLMISSLTLQRATKKELIAFYKKENCKNMAYQASLFSNKEFEQALAQQLQVTYNQIAQFIKEHHCEISEQFVPVQEDNYIKLLGLFHTLFTKLINLDFLLMKEVIQVIKQHSTFLKQSIESEENPKLALQNLKNLIEPLIEKEPNNVYPIDMKITSKNNINHNSL